VCARPCTHHNSPIARMHWRSQWHSAAGPVATREYQRRESIDFAARAKLLKFCNRETHTRISTYTCWGTKIYCWTSQRWHACGLRVMSRYNAFFVDRFLVFADGFAASVGSPSLWLSDTASFVIRRTIAGLMNVPSRKSRVAISYFPPFFKRGSNSRSRWPRQNPNRTRFSSARISRTGPL
jgi:hypothetical protein